MTGRHSYHQYRPNRPDKARWDWQHYKPILRPRPDMSTPYCWVRNRHDRDRRRHNFYRRPRHLQLPGTYRQGTIGPPDNCRQDFPLYSCSVGPPPGRNNYYQAPGYIPVHIHTGLHIGRGRIWWPPWRIPYRYRHHKSGPPGSGRMDGKCYIRHHKASRCRWYSNNRCHTSRWAPLPNRHLLSLMACRCRRHRRNRPDNGLGDFEHYRRWFPVSLSGRHHPHKHRFRKHHGDKRPNRADNQPRRYRLRKCSR